MKENNAYSGSPSSGSNSPLEDTFDQMSGTKPTIGEQATKASRAALDEVKTLGGEAQQIAQDKADKVKDMAASHIDAFADALRAASDELSKNQSGPASEMIAHAATGLENLSRSLQGKSTGEMVDTLRQFGRTNPMGFMAGSVLAGLALGRFSAASAPAASPASGTEGSSQWDDASPTDVSTRNDRGITQ